MSEAPTTTRQRFRPAQKLRSAADFERVARTGRRTGDAFFGVQYVANGLGQARLGMAVGLRAAGSAVRRNRIRRIIRESFRLHQHSLPATDIVVSARAGSRAAPSAELFASLSRLWGRIRT